MRAVVHFPRMVRVRRAVPPAAAVDIEGELASGIRRTRVLEAYAPGARIAVAVGSRGIDRLSPMVLAVVRLLRDAGLSPFLIPAMGSHGGATAEGQRELLAGLGITEEGLGVPLEAAMDADAVARTEDGFEVFCGRAAREADGIFLINRIKPHTDFGGALGSGLLKMAVVGVGKHAGARAFHQAAQRVGHERALRTLATALVGAVKFVGGLAVIEDACHRLARLEVVAGGDLLTAEPRLASEAAGWMPKLPLTDIDLLILDQIGKDISGTGMDPNVTGRPIHGYSLIESELPGPPRVRRIFVRDLSPGSHGNANGIGMADFTTTRLVRAMDPQSTYTNSLTALSLLGSKIPIHFPTDREVLEAALPTLGLAEVREARVLRVRDTLSLDRLEVSEACLREVQAQEGIEVEEGRGEMEFDASGNLLPFGAESRSGNSRTGS